MQINNTIFEKKHHYMLIMRETEILKKQMEYEVLSEEISNDRLQEVYRIFNMVFIGLLREGLAYQYIKNADNSKKDIIKITIDNIEYDCKVTVLKKLLGDEYYDVMKIRPDENVINENNQEDNLSNTNEDNNNKKHIEKDLISDENNDNINDDTSTSESEIDDCDTKSITKEEKEAIEIEPIYNDDTYEYIEEKEKSKSTMFVDKWHLKVFEQGAVIGQDIDLMIFPMVVKQNVLVSDIVVWAKCGREIKTFVSEKVGKKSIEVNIGEHSFLVRGCFKQGKFETSVIPAGITLAINANINKEKEEIRPTNMNNINDGHITYKMETNDDVATIHVFPTEFKNNENGAAETVICYEKGDDRKLFDTYNQKIILLDGKNADIQIMNYWNDDILITDSINRD